ncbi:MAG TPA: hypothetical protein PKE57_00385 [Cellvibrionaceae bacterium]|nr:hypothetical protein [Cellvibrionaceae bacterium]HMW47946.1 hypothetical protein [Cellvibrionaceae bacterium]HMW71222.1 hypothetical protein [Cellvibrionaceae bacterium]HMY37921.1 hypothetical protein [Marinagarivorans sp.]HNG60133.1 hypothetical protein [Cellvibrionaceae bacterium]
MSLPLDQALGLAAQDLAHLAPDRLAELKQAAAECLAFAEAITHHLDTAVNLRYGEHAQQLRASQGKNTGVVHFDDGAVRVSADLPSQIVWDQSRLAEIARRIRANGDDPAEYMELRYDIPEATFNAWPDALKSAFTLARTRLAGTPTYRLALMRDAASASREG